MGMDLGNGTGPLKREGGGGAMVTKTLEQQIRSFRPQTPSFTSIYLSAIRSAESTADVLPQQPAAVNTWGGPRGWPCLLIKPKQDKQRDKTN